MAFIKKLTSLLCFGMLLITTHSADSVPPRRLSDEEASVISTMLSTLTLPIFKKNKFDRETWVHAYDEQSRHEPTRAVMLYDVVENYLSPVMKSSDVTEIFGEADWKWDYKTSNSTVECVSYSLGIPEMRHQTTLLLFCPIKDEYVTPLLRLWNDERLLDAYEINPSRKLKVKDPKEIRNDEALFILNKEMYNNPKPTLLNNGYEGAYMFGYSFLKSTDLKK